MNEAIEKIARAHIPETGSAPLSFVKFNTAGSPLRGYPKVLFFCFTGEKNPRWCLKTVRAAANNEVILKGFENLEALNRSAGSTNVFARAIWAGEVDGIMWSIEEAAPGRRPDAGEIPRVVDAYITFQKAAGSTRTVSTEEKAGELISALDVEETERKAMRDVCALHCKGDATLIPQHGDFTQDNVLFDGTRVTLIDCDSYMPEGIAGFDLFHFLSRVPNESGIKQYLQSYKEALGMAREFDAGDLCLWILQERALKKMQGAPRDQEQFSTAFGRLRKLFGV